MKQTTERLSNFGSRIVAAGDLLNEKKRELEVSFVLRFDCVEDVIRIRRASE